MRRPTPSQELESAEGFFVPASFCAPRGVVPHWIPSWRDQTRQTYGRAHRQHSTSSFRSGCEAWTATARSFHFAPREVPTLALAPCPADVGDNRSEHSVSVVQKSRQRVAQQRDESLGLEACARCFALNTRRVLRKGVLRQVSSSQLCQRPELLDLSSPAARPLSRTSSAARKGVKAICPNLSLAQLWCQRKSFRT